VKAYLYRIIRIIQDLLLIPATRSHDLGQLCVWWTHSRRPGASIPTGVPNSSRRIAIFKDANPARMRRRLHSEARTGKPASLILVDHAGLTRASTAAISQAMYALFGDDATDLTLPEARSGTIDGRRGRVVPCRPLGQRYFS
jgi:hypothetical protein